MLKQALDDCGKVITQLEMFISHEKQMLENENCFSLQVIETFECIASETLKHYFEEEKQLNDYYQEFTERILNRNEVEFKQRYKYIKKNATLLKRSEEEGKAIVKNH